MPTHRPKRPASNPTTHPDLSSLPPRSTSNLTRKRVRFDARNPSTLASAGNDSDDASDGQDEYLLSIDSIGRAARRDQADPGAKRSAVVLDGYESDSDPDNFDARAAERARNIKRGEREEDDDDDDDMFAEEERDDDEGEDEKDHGLSKKGKKEVRFLKQEDIEGQVLGSRSGGHVQADFSKTYGPKGKTRMKEEDESESSSCGEEERARAGSDVDEEVGAGGKKKHTPRLDAFNTKQENEEGAFDESGNYVRRAADPDAVHDAWLAGVSRKEMRKAREAEEKREKERAERSMEGMAAKSVPELLAVLIERVEEGETVLEALQRLGKGVKKAGGASKWKTKKKNVRKDTMDVESGVTENGKGEAAEVDDPDRKRREAVEAISEAADALFSRGNPEIYDAERILLKRVYKRSARKDWVDRVPEPETTAKDSESQEQWEFRWADGRDGGGIHGPYGKDTMAAWEQAGYFASGGVEFKKKNGESWESEAVFS